MYICLHVYIYIFHLFIIIQNSCLYPGEQKELRGEPFLKPPRVYKATKVLALIGDESEESMKRHSEWGNLVVDWLETDLRR